MRRIAVHFSEDIAEQEIAAMARDHGFVVRHINNTTVVDRVPNWLRHDVPEATVLRMPTRVRKVAR